MGFEVGKKYKDRHSGFVWEVVAIHGSYVWMKHTKGESHYLDTWLDRTFDQFTEYKEPIKHVRYFNVYREDSQAKWTQAYCSRKQADKQADLPNRIGRVRVEFTEGQYDD